MTVADKEEASEVEGSADDRFDDDRSIFRRGLVLVRELVGLHPLPFSIAVAGSIMFAAALVGSSWVLGVVVDRVVTPTFKTGVVPSGTLWWTIVAVIGVTITRMIGVVFRRYYAGLTAERVQITFRRRLTSRYLGLPLSWYQQNQTGELLALSDIDVEKSVDLLHPLPFSIGAVSIVFFSLIYLFTVDPWITLVALAVFPLLGLGNSWYSKRVEAPAAEGQAAVGRVSAIAHESFEGALVVKTLGRVDAEIDRFDAASQELRARRIEVGYLRASFEPLLDLIPGLGILAAVVVSAYRIRVGAMSPGEMVTVVNLFSVLAFPVRVFGYFLETVPPSLVSRNRLERVFEDEAASVLSYHPDDGPVRLPPTAALGLELSEVSFAYRGGEYQADVPVLTDVGFTVEPGEVVALVGSTGSGKSTVAQLAAGLIPPSRGRVKLGGVALETLAPAERTASLAMVFQESFMFADSIRANIDLSGTTPDGDVERAAGLARVDTFVDDLPDGYSTVLGERGVNLSGGQRQRVALARALVRRPRFLILDDATSAVDPRIEQEILAGLRQELQASTLIVAQRVATIGLADRVVFLADGRVVATGSHDELMALPAYETLVRAYEVAP